jgi:hypothetical protein
MDFGRFALLTITVFLILAPFAYLYWNITDAQKTRDRSKYNPNDHPGPPIGGGGVT